jgi:SAM-dependent methyltransferase
VSVFRADQFEDCMPDGMDDHYWHRARNRVIARHLADLPGIHDGVVLEVGCGRGIVVQHLIRRGYRVVGVELGRPVPISAEVAPHLHLGVDAFALPERLRADVRMVLLLDVLEHLDDPRAFLAQLGARFARLGHVFVTLPARQELWSNYDEHYGHKLRFDHSSLAELVTASGLDLADYGYFFHALYPPARAMAGLNRQRAITVHAPSGAARAAHALVGAVLALEERLLPRRIRGTSLWAALSVPGR